MPSSRRLLFCHSKLPASVLTQYSASINTRWFCTSHCAPLWSPPSSSAVKARIRARDGVQPSCFRRMKLEGWAPSRDLILAFTADKEGGDHNGAQDRKSTRLNSSHQINSY